MKKMNLLLVLLLCFTSCQTKGQTQNELSVSFHERDLLINWNREEFRVGDLAAPELEPYVLITDDGLGFYLSHSYSASSTKRTVIYSFAVVDGKWILDRVFELCLDVHHGKAFGWLALSEGVISIDQIDYDKLVSFTEHIKYELNDSCLVVFIDESNRFVSKYEDDSESLGFSFPIFVNDDFLVGDSHSA